MIKTSVLTGKMLFIILLFLKLCLFCLDIIVFLFVHSASFCDVDENGVRHMIYCRVIMGNMEPLSPGTKQFHPSTQDYDSGVDDLHSPKHFIVWSMNMNTHIFPEFVVSFKVPARAEGDTLPLLVLLFV